MTDEQIERRVEKMVDHLDRVFLASDMSQADYDKAMADAHKWAEGKRAEQKKLEEQKKADDDAGNERGWTGAQVRALRDLHAALMGHALG